MPVVFNLPMLLALGIFIVSLVIWKHSGEKSKADYNEPPCVPARIPYIGHAIGLYWHRTDYYTKLR
jgi:hypothetical protein